MSAQPASERCECGHVESDHDSDVCSGVLHCTAYRPASDGEHCLIAGCQTAVENYGDRCDDHPTVEAKLKMKERQPNGTTRI